MKKINLAITVASLAAMAITPQIASASATRVTNYTTLVNALKMGHRIIAIGDNTKCTVKEYDNDTHKSDGMPDPDLEMTIGISFTSNFFLTYRDFGDKRYHVLAVATNVGNFADHTPIQRLKQIKIFDDNTATMYAAASDFRTGKIKSHITSACGISNGHDQNGLSIFDYDAVS